MRPKYDFGKYVLMEQIGKGGMAEIYKAKYFGERGFAKDVAVKRVLPAWADRKDFETMLVDEARALVHLQHQNIVQIFELGKDGDYFYISMEYVDGVDLRRLFKKVGGTGIAAKYALFVIMEVLKGLDFAHRQRGDDGSYLNIVHRDVSPQNILLSYNGEVKLTDFGIAKGGHREEETTTIRLKGKYAYMSPEQASGQSIDHRSDIYSTAVVLYEILTGRRLFASGNDFDTIEKVRKSRLPRGWENSVTPGIRSILQKALSKNRDERYQTAGEFLKDLDSYSSEKRQHTHSLEFSDYLNNLFAGERLEKKISNGIKCDGTKVLSTVARTENVARLTGKRWRQAALIVAFIPMLAGASARTEGRGDNLIHPAIKNEETKVVIPAKKTPAQKPVAPEGMLNINSQPEGAKGTLIYGDKREDFVTPFIRTGIDIKNGYNAKLILKNNGRENVKEMITLDADNPIFTKTYKLSSDAMARLSVQARPWGYVNIPGVVNGKESPLNGLKLKPGKYKVKVHYSPKNLWASADIVLQPGSSHKCFADFTGSGRISCR